jgi:trigger factor
VSATISRRILRDDSESRDSDDDAAAETNPPRDDIEVELGGRGVMQEFTDAFTGSAVSETKQFEVEYPEDYKPEQFAGRRVAYTGEVTAIRARELPDLDDEFAKTVGEEFATLEDLRQKLRSNLEHQAEHRTEEEFRTSVMDQLIDRNRFEVPDVVVDQQIDARMRQMFRSLAGQGLDPRTLKIDWDALRESHRERAVREVRGAFILDSIAEAEKTEVTDDEINKEIETMAQGMGQSVESVKSRLTQDGSIDRLREQVRNRKALESVIESAEMKIEEVPSMGESDATSQPA